MKLRKSIHRRIVENLNHPDIFYHGSSQLFDRFDMDKIGTGYELSKFGYGLYFSNTLAQAEYYAYEASRGKGQTQYIYEVKIFEKESFLEWDHNIPENVHHQISKKLREIDQEDEANDMDQELEEYMETWSMASTYEIMTAILGGMKEASEFLYDCGIGGVISDAVIHDAKVYTTFSDRVKIIDVYPSQHDDDPYIGS